MNIERFIPKGRKGFSSAINCIDGRGQDAVAKKARRQTRTRHVDTITGPGIVAGLANGDETVIERVKSELAVSLTKHDSQGIVVGGHQSCAGNPVDDETHKGHSSQGVQEVNSWENVHVPVIGVFVEPRKTLFRRRPSTRRKWKASQVV